MGGGNRNTEQAATSKVAKVLYLPREELISGKDEGFAMDAKIWRDWWNF